MSKDNDKSVNKISKLSVLKGRAVVTPSSGSPSQLKMDKKFELEKHSGNFEFGNLIW